ncbi:MAG TPA: HDIG domain-containing protein [Spirochaetota bacterium]|nr:HDIG domain-containing protein [Spirochaetota bacterium]HPP03411.1 HDIG domain-containing protein [Spirochaetota bacterium]
MITYLIIVFQPITMFFNQKIGDVLKNDVIALKNIKYVDKKKTEEKIKEIRQNATPIFTFDYDITKEKLKTILNVLDILLITENISDINKIIEKNDLQITKNDIDIIRNLIEKDPYFIKKFSNIYLSISENGIIEDNINSDMIIMVNKNEPQKEILYKKDEIKKLKLNFSLLKDKVDKEFSFLSQKERYFIFSLLNKLIVPNIFFDKEKSELRIKREIETGGVVYNEIKKDQIMARKGDMITEDNYDKIMAVTQSINNELKSNFNFIRLMFLFLLLLSFVLFSYYFIKIYDYDFFKSVYNILFVSIIIIIFVVLVDLPIYFSLNKQNIYYGLFIPLASLGITLAFLYSKEISIIFIIIISLLFFIISEYNYTSFIFLFFSGISSVFITNNITKRGDLLKSGIFVAMINIVISTIIVFNSSIKEINYLYFFIISFLNGILSSILAIGLITLGESILNSATVFRLHELSELSLPLMRELFNSAVGTYNHSILVGNLAESAANAINANGLLARIGGYYHDIGKIENSEYFIENQGEYNIHDDLKPSISVAIIKSHVKKGIEYAKKHKLPQKVIDIISQHHGNSLIKYFYNKALAMNDMAKEEVKEDFYRYNGEKPKFPEAAIVMLADQVEAATRALKKHTVNTIENLVDSIIVENYEAGQLDDSGLTLKDLTKIKEIFIKLLIGMYHSRIEYQKENKIEIYQKNGIN